MSLFASIAERLCVETSLDKDATGKPVPVEEDEQTPCACDSVGFVFGETADAGRGKLYITTK